MKSLEAKRTQFLFEKGMWAAVIGRRVGIVMWVVGSGQQVKGHGVPQKLGQEVVLCFSFAKNVYFALGALPEEGFDHVEQTVEPPGCVDNKCFVRALRIVVAHHGDDLSNEVEEPGVMQYLPSGVGEVEDGCHDAVGSGYEYVPAVLDDVDVVEHEIFDVESVLGHFVEVDFSGALYEDNVVGDVPAGEVVGEYGLALVEGGVGAGKDGVNIVVFSPGEGVVECGEGVVAVLFLHVEVAGGDAVGVFFAAVSGFEQGEDVGFFFFWGR